MVYSTSDVFHVFIGPEHWRATPARQSAGAAGYSTGPNILSRHMPRSGDPDRRDFRSGCGVWTAAVPAAKGAGETPTLPTAIHRDRKPLTGASRFRVPVSPSDHAMSFGTRPPSQILPSQAGGQPRIPALGSAVRAFLGKGTL